MKMLIVAAGQGTRLRPLTNEIPKCMVKFKNKCIIDYILEAAKNCRIKDIGIINGYKSTVLENYLKFENIKFFNNKNYENTNMVSSLFCAEEFMDDDLIISYADIIYQKKILKQLMNSKDNFSVVVDRNWKELWSLRMENPLDDAETLKIKNGNIIEIGKKAYSYNQIEGQYIGLFKISKKIIRQVIKFYYNLNKESLYDGKNFDNMFMTSFIQLVIDNLLNVTPIFIDGGWIEIDSLDDLKKLETIDEKFNL
ncbi:sugar phosphate nucleotidyltransferase [Candidatus Pelagibacter sp. HIMB1495]|uniref:phosphocholine cytidylyltransferase family protein n=1 Tax=unclassified Candidatus Pelagibacter TaxID=2647897 RepID=UPI003F8652B6